MRIAIIAFLVPIVWVLLTLYVIQPIERLARKHCPKWLYVMLTKKRFTKG
jgi:hypothetical protein